MTKRYLQYLVVVLAMACVPLPAQADQIAPNPNPFNGTIEIPPTEVDATNTVEFINTGQLMNYGTLTNYGTLYNEGTLLNDDLSTLNNYGTLINDSVGRTYNKGTLNNYGILNIFQVGQITGVYPLFDTYRQITGQTILNGTLSQGHVDIQGGFLRGSGNITNTLPVPVLIGAGATIAPGNTIDTIGALTGTLTINGDFSSSGNFEFEIGWLGIGNNYDVLDINGNAAFNGGHMQFDFIDGFNASAGNYWDFILANAYTGWDTLSFTVNGLGAGLAWQIDSGDTYRRLLITADGGGAAPVSEPSTMLLLGSGLAGLVGYGRKRMKM